MAMKWRHGKQTEDSGTEYENWINHKPVKKKLNTEGYIAECNVLTFGAGGC
jgi:hypothetical protein